MFERIVSAWNRNDASRCAAEFADDASLINPFGQEARGSAAIAGLYGEYSSTMLKGTMTTYTTSHSRGGRTAGSRRRHTVHRQYLRA